MFLSFPPFLNWMYIARGLIFKTWLVPLLALPIGALVLLAYSLWPHEPSQSDIVQAFKGYKTKHLEIGPVSGMSNIAKRECKRSKDAGGYLCEIAYTSQRNSSNAEITHVRVFHLFALEGGGWGRQFWNEEAKINTVKSVEWREGHALGTLIGYTLACIAGSLLLCRVLPSVPWKADGMNDRATPWAGYSVRSGSNVANNVADGITNAANSLTPAAAMMIFSLALGVGGFLLGAWFLPKIFIDLRVMRWIERLCLLLSGISIAAVGFSLSMLVVRLAALSFAVFVMYLVFFLPAAWIFYGNSPVQTISNNIASIENLLVNSQSKSINQALKLMNGTKNSSKEGFEGYQQIFE